MDIARPIGKEFLKRVFLKLLIESYHPGGGRGYDWPTVLAAIPARLGAAPPLLLEEKELGQQGVMELENDGYIRTDPSQSSQLFKLLTEKGKSEASKPLDDMRLPSIDLRKLLTNEELRKKVMRRYSEGEYEGAISDAFLFLEEKIRAQAGLTPSDNGDGLLIKVFNSTSGVLKHPEAKTSSEVEGLFFLMRGAYKWYRNSTHHRTVGYDDPYAAAQVLGMVNLLADIVDQCTK